MLLCQTNFLLDCIKVWQQYIHFRGGYLKASEPKWVIQMKIKVLILLQIYEFYYHNK